MATNKPKRAVPKSSATEGPKRSVAKPTTAQSAAAKKKAAVKKSAAEGPKRSISKPSATAIAIAKSKPKVVEASVGNIPMAIAKVGIALGKKIASNGAKTKTTPKPTQPTSTQIKRAKDYGLTTKKEIEAFAAGDRGKFLAAAERTAARKTSNARQATSQREEAKAQSYANAKKQPKVSKEKSTTAKLKGKRMTDKFGNSGWR